MLCAVRVVVRLKHLSGRYHTRSIYCTGMGSPNPRSRQNRRAANEHYPDTRCLSFVHVSPETNYQVAISGDLDSFSVVLFILIAFVFSPAAWIAYIVREKESKCKHQQVCLFGLLCIPSTHGTSKHVWLARHSKPSMARQEESVQSMHSRGTVFNEQQASFRAWCVWDPGV